MAVRLFCWIQKYWLGLIISAILSILIDWKIGYYCNAIYGTKFDLQSCWTGLTTVGSAGFLAGVKYLTDSWLNTKKEEMPEYNIGGESK